jgi:CubicO group peptidase (beta-lactamase class C family)
LYSEIRVTVIRATDRLLAGAVESGLFSKASYAIARRGELAARRDFGHAGEQSVYDLASLTKPLATAIAILQLAERGHLILRDPAAAFFGNQFGPLPNLALVQIRHLLTHTSGLPSVPAWPDAPSERHAYFASILSSTPSHNPGEVYRYSDTGYLILGEIIASVSGQSLDSFFEENIANPLGLRTMGFQSSVHDPRARDLGGVAGHAGLFGALDDVLVLAETIRQGGSPILSPASAARMASTQIPAVLGAQSYGWFCEGNPMMPSGDLFSDKVFAHTGFTGVSIVIDPTFEMSVVLLTDRVIGHPGNQEEFIRFRRLWHNTVAGGF